MKSTLRSSLKRLERLEAARRKQAEAAGRAAFIVIGPLVLTHGAKAIEIEDIEARVAELERAAEAAQASQDGGVTS